MESKITGYSQIDTVSMDDKLYIVKTSDTTQSPQGSSYWGTVSQVLALATANVNPAVENTYLTITEMIADQANQTPGNFQYVVDASLDPAVTSGDAYYNRLSTADGDLGDYNLLNDGEIVTLNDGVHTFGIAEIADPASDAVSGLSNVNLEYDGVDITHIVFNANYSEFLAAVKTTFDAGNPFKVRVFNKVTRKQFILDLTSIDWSDGTNTYMKAAVGTGIDTAAVATHHKIEVYFDYYEAGGGFSAPVARTGSTILFDVPAEYNASSPVSSGNITLDNTGAVAGVVQDFYFNGAAEPTISGITIQARTGQFHSNIPLIYQFKYNTAGNVVLSILSDNTPQLIAPQNFLVVVASSTALNISWDANANANNYILERDVNSDFSTATQIYSGSSLTYSDTGLTTDTTYYYRVKAQGTNYVDSVWSTASAAPYANSFTVVGLVEGPTGTFEAQAASNYANNYGVDSTNGQTGAFTFTISLDNSSVNPEGCMFGVSTSATNDAWNTGNWTAGAYVVNGGLAINKIVSGVATATGSTAVLTAGNTLKITRDGSNNVKLLYNDVEIHDFGTISGTLYYHISAYTNKYVIVQ